MWFTLAVALSLASQPDLHALDAGSPYGTRVRSGRPPSSASELVIDRDVLKATPRQGAVDLLRAVPGLVATQHSGEGKAHQLYLRGFDALHGQDVEINVAGLPVNERSHVHAQGYADVNWVMPEVVREIQVTEGTSRAWQGDFAVAGSLRYELGLEAQGFHLNASLSQLGRQRMFVGLQPTSDGDTFAALELVRGPGFGPQRAFSRTSFIAQATHTFDEARVRAVVASASARFESPGVVRADLQDLEQHFFDAFGAGQGGASERHQVLLSVERDHGDSRTRAEGFGILTQLSLSNNFTGFLRSLNGDGVTQRHRALSGGVLVSHRQQIRGLPAPAAIELGVAYRQDGIAQQQAGYDALTLQERPADFDVQSTLASGSAYVEASLAPWPWRATLGARADVLGVETRQGPEVRHAMGPHLGLKASLSRAVGSSWRVFTAYGDGFRSPQARGLADGERAPYVSVRSAEIGANVETQRLHAAAALFGSYVADEFYFDHLSTTTVSVGPAFRGGAQLSTTAKPLDGLTLAGSVTLAHAALAETGAALPYFAPVVVRADTGYERPFDLLKLRASAMLGLGVTALGPRNLPFGDRAQGFVLVDLRARLLVERLGVIIDVQNLFDMRWRDGEYTFASRWTPDTVASLVPARHFTAGQPRTLTVTLELTL